MNTALIKYLALGLLVVAGAGGAFVYFNNAQAPSPEGGSSTEQESSEKNGLFSGSLADLMQRGGNWKCEFEHTVSGVTSQGTVYVAGGSIRGDFTSKVPQLTSPVESHMIQDGGYVYVWSSLVPQGFKSKSAVGASSTGGAQSGGVDINQQLDYACAPWAKDASKFALPAGIEFIGN